MIELPNLFTAAEMGRFVLGCIIGAGVVWSSVVRTLAVKDASMQDALVGSLVNSVAYWFSIHFVVKDDLIGYTGTAVGSTLIILIMTMNAKKGREVWEMKKRQKKL